MTSNEVGNVWNGFSLWQTEFRVCQEHVISEKKKLAQS